METLLVLGETSRSSKKSSFGTPILLDQNGNAYQLVERRYKTLLERDSNFIPKMRAFDFKIVRAKGKKWQEPPRVGDLLQFRSPIGDAVLCSGTVCYVNLGRKRSVGIVYIEDFVWTSTSIPDLTS